MIKVQILTPEWNREVEADAVFLPGSLGQFEVLDNHAPIISTLEAGSISWRVGEDMEELKVKGGVMRLENNEMQVCVEV